jgi:hypothetical protein
MSLTGGKRKVNKSLKDWVAFVKKVQKEEKLSYKDAIHRAKQRKDKGEKWKTGGAIFGGSDVFGAKIAGGLAKAAARGRSMARSRGMGMGMAGGDDEIETEMEAEIPIEDVEISADVTDEVQEGGIFAGGRKRRSTRKRGGSRRRKTRRARRHR